MYKGNAGKISGKRGIDVVDGLAVPLLEYLSCSGRILLHFIGLCLIESSQTKGAVNIDVHNDKRGKN